MFDFEGNASGGEVMLNYGWMASSARRVIFKGFLEFRVWGLGSTLLLAVYEAVERPELNLQV